MLNALAWLVTGPHLHGYIAPVLRQLLWLPVSRKSISNSFYVFTSHCMVDLRRTCVMTVNSSGTAARVSCRGHSHRLSTEVSL